jgi:hypothetical protein
MGEKKGGGWTGAASAVTSAYHREKPRSQIMTPASFAFSVFLPGVFLRAVAGWLGSGKS